MNLLAYLVMWGWIPVILYLFTRFPVQRALVISFVVAWLFLPQAEIVFSGIPNYTKISATCYGALLATFFFDGERFQDFRYRWIDVPMTLWCIAPFFSSVANGLGAYDGLSATLSQIVTWGLPYFLGRLYLGNRRGLKELVLGFVIGGAVYVPLCLLEVRLSPQLHRWIYGYFPHSSFGQTMRYGGFRPTVFMQHGLMVGAWMMAATLVAFWLWHQGVLKDLWNIPMVAIVAALGGTLILVKSTGAVVLAALGVILLLSLQLLRTRLPILIIVGVACLYLGFGAVGWLTPDQRASIVETVAQVTNEARAGSLEFRMENEALLAERAREQPVFGWGGWGRARVYDERGKDRSVTDSLWIIAFGNYGAVGLLSLMSALLLPVLGLFFWRFSDLDWGCPQAAPVAVLGVLLLLYVLDCLVNAMINPVFILMAGGLSGLVSQPRHQSVPQRRKRVVSSGRRVPARAAFKPLRR
ncbi:O-antigen ligase domain-containing protein [Synechococcales cyanobacterium C]|uniref:O-antigen ligase domain-containing protein n=1 Tax=Petrachloros mirabilis ULC683 TaxID=2781853 RepID=A0A8K2A283_9CYAN|nr:O-antigen ligase domain-containing protein [Petrachloros mirabilis]NCJ08396.1 O-antigen ligase domain-containing protein [Petrachloros mirabilis ULC683]